MLTSHLHRLPPMQVERLDASMLFSIDDVGVMVRTDGKAAPEEEAWVILNKNADTRVEAAHSNVRRKTGASREGYQPLTSVKLTVAMSAGLSVAPAFMMIMGMTAEEMDHAKHPSGVVVVRVEGMGMGVSNVVGDPGDGFIAFVAASGVTDNSDGLTPAARAHAYYLKHVFHPYVNRIRMMNGWKEGEPYGQAHMAAKWTDGQYDQTLLAMSPTGVLVNGVLPPPPSPTTAPPQTALCKPPPPSRPPSPPSLPRPTSPTPA
jgi:hypothetical protein